MKWQIYFISGNVQSYIINCNLLITFRKWQEVIFLYSYFQKHPSALEIMIFIEVHNKIITWNRMISTKEICMSFTDVHIVDWRYSSHTHDISNANHTLVWCVQKLGFIHNAGRSMHNCVYRHIVRRHWHVFRMALHNEGDWHMGTWQRAHAFSVLYHAFQCE